MIRSTHLFTLLIVLLAAMFTSCSSGTMEIDIPEDVAELENVAVYSGDAAPLHDITFKRQARFGDSGDIYIGSMAGVAVTDDGTLFLADRTEAVIHIYSASGEYQSSIGGKGEGPGEFLSISSVRLYNGKLFALDTQQQRVSVFDAAGQSYLRSHTLSGGTQDLSGFPVAAEPLSDGRFFVLYNTMQREDEKFYRRYMPRIMDAEGNTLASEFIEFPRSEMLMLQSDNMIRITSLPFLGESHIGFNQNKEVVTGFSDRLLLHVISLDGDTLRSIYHSNSPPLLNRAEMLAKIEDETSRKEISAMDIPETRQAYETFYVDDENRIWVSITTEDIDVNDWWVLSESGEKLSEFSRTATDRVMFVNADHIYFMETDEDTGLQEIVKYIYSFDG
ncbi:BF3164 family lipoprotein [Rhodohalobacter sp. 8-1]|uniref:BF3164 family lipoprotein n=1 Tax=Rhodohalobacter sp. 8-1 TaxID=3131972 RepID=UPI0030EF2A0C